MAKVVDIADYLQERRAVASSSSVYDGPCEVLIFDGIRYERLEVAAHRKPASDASDFMMPVAYNFES
ncbi:MAG: hypothetical protein AAFP99_12510 [Pseudomonadota bacterium]